MAINVTYNGVAYTIPTRGELNWDSVNSYLVALGTSLPAGGSGAPLTSELDFGAAFGVKSIYYKSRTANPAATGQVRLANGDTVSWRNVANSADLALSTNSNNRLALAGVEQADLSSTQTLTNKTLTAPTITGTVGGTPAFGSGTTIADQNAYTNFTYLNSWTSASVVSNQGAAQYYRNALGEVGLRGAINTGTAGTVMGNLPVGYRPSVALQFVGNLSNAGVSVITIASNGDVTPAVITGTYNTSTGWFSLAGILFRAV